MQKSFSDLEYAAKKKLTRRDRFLKEIDSVTPWNQLHKLVEPFYPKVEGEGSSTDRFGTYAADVRSPTMLWFVG
jgi:hypothetical protein